MKKLIYFVVAALTFAACSKAEMPESNEEITLSYNISLPHTSRALGEGNSVTHVAYALYTPQGELVKSFEPVAFTGGSANCSVVMMRGEAYKVLFTAQHYDSGVPVYPIDMATATLTVPTSCIANSDNYDFFSNVVEVTASESSISSSISLKRKVGLLTIESSAANWDDAASLGVIPTHSSLTLKNVPASYNLLSETISSSTVTVNYATAALPEDQNTIASCFCFTGQNQSITTKADLNVYAGGNTESPVRSTSIDNLTIKNNCITIASGSVLTGTATFTVTIDTKFFE